MNSARRNAPRYWAVLLAIAVFGSAAEAWATELQLTLPLVAVLSVSVAGSAAQAFGATAPGGSKGGLLGLLPKQLQIPDGYALDPVPDPPRWAKGADRDRLVGFDLFHQQGKGLTGTVAYDIESRGPLAPSADLIRVLIEYRF